MPAALSEDSRRRAKEIRRTDFNAGANCKQMKRTITEIFIEVEETVAIRQTAQAADVANEAQPANEPIVCPSCGQTMPDNKNLQQEEKDKNEP